MENELSILLLSHDLELSAQLRSSLTEILPKAHLRFARTDRDAILYLRGMDIYSNRFCYPFPDLVLLDAEHPDESDLRFVDWIRKNEEFSMLPLVLLANEADDLLLQNSYDVGANSFHVNRDNPADLCEVITSIQEMKGSWASGAPFLQRQD